MKKIGDPFVPRVGTLSQKTGLKYSVTYYGRCHRLSTYSGSGRKQLKQNNVPSVPYNEGELGRVWENSREFGRVWERLEDFERVWES